jgi:hypothetical protein
MAVRVFLLLNLLIRFILIWRRRRVLGRKGRVQVL